MNQETATREPSRSVNLRAREPRLAVLMWLAEHPHTTAEQVRSGARAELASVSTQAVYDFWGLCPDCAAGEPAAATHPIKEGHA